ncbi:unnamed protein product [Rotaria sp. Silwood2]|nr:unnamed protein product [Rotaria sp. Silwood2]CAF4489782.1 unnamed protein product [Rotaria sp. Silwood2]CAF4569169.1 unnamed protein product [Rotaria sp. Silwood2]
MQKISHSSKATLQTKAEYFRHSLAEHGESYLSDVRGVYLLGSTNTEKTSLFNSLIDSDLRHIHALGCIQRATESNLPGKDIY